MCCYQLGDLRPLTGVPMDSTVVGDGLLAASVSGDIFGSPSARQVLGSIRSVPSDAGTILVVTNYTGDCLHFGLATQQARAMGVKNIEMIMITDDVAVPRSAGALVGRRALGGTPAHDPTLPNSLPSERQLETPWLPSELLSATLTFPDEPNTSNRQSIPSSSESECTTNLDTLSSRRNQLRRI